MNQVLLIRAALEAALRRFVGQPGCVAIYEAGVNRTPQLTELICRDGRFVTPNGWRNLPAPRTPFVFLRLQQRPGPNEEGCERLFTLWRRDLSQFLAGQVALLALEQAPVRGLVAGTLFSSRGDEPIHSLKIVGPGMYRVVAQAGRAAYPEQPLPPDERERWSRAIGALGEEAWRRFRSLRYALIGVGRSGSLVAGSLARLGVRHLALIDPDRLEPHNLDAMDGVTARDVGRLKVNAVQESLGAMSGSFQVAHPLPDSITTLRALLAVKEADLLLACVDHDGARLATGVLASLYAKPLLDIGTGIFGTGETRRMGGDVRLILPGDRCLICLGAVANPQQARTVFIARRLPAPPGLPWQQQRAGSLRSLNQIAAHLGVRLLEDLVGERVSSSLWIRLEFDPHGLPTLHRLTPHANPACPLCRQMGAGDDGLGAVRDLVGAAHGTDASGSDRPTPESRP